MDFGDKDQRLNPGPVPLHTLPLSAIPSMGLFLEEKISNRWWLSGVEDVLSMFKALDLISEPQKKPNKQKPPKQMF